MFYLQHHEVVFSVCTMKSAK